jgi:putative hydrolase of the HAD superfamily
MPGPKIKAIIFDIGRVIIRIDLRKAQIGLAKGLAMTPDELWSAIEKDPRWKDWQEGRISARDWHQNLSKRLKIPLDFDQFCAVWNGILDPETILGDDIFQALAERYCMALLSNTDKIHVEHIESNYNFVKHFPKDRRIYSCTVGVSKPDPVIYREALKACKAKASEAIYIDDIEVNVEAARKLGLHGIVFASRDQFLQDLRSLAVEIPVSPTK